MFAMMRLGIPVWAELVRAAYAEEPPEPGAPRLVDELSEQSIMAAVHAAVVEYVNEPDLCSDDEREFPSRTVLTGRYYVRRISDLGRVAEFPSGVERRSLLISCTCFGRRLVNEEPYLGLDVRLSAPLDSQVLRLDAVDSSVE